MFDKNKYVCHCVNLKLYKSLGMVVTRVHRAIKFKQSAWMAGYINLNIAKRQQAAANDDEIGKVIYKLLNNAVSIQFLCIYDLRDDHFKNMIWKVNIF